MRLLLITPEYPPAFGGGIGSYYGVLAPALVDLGWQVTVVAGSANAPGPDAGEADGVRVVPLDSNRTRALARRFPQFDLAPDFCAHLGAAWAAWEQADAGRNFDVVECTDWGLPFVPWIVSREPTPPTLVRLHGSIGQINAHDPRPSFGLSENLAAMAERSLLPHAAGRATCSLANQKLWSEILRQEVLYTPPPLHTNSLPDPLPPSAHGLVAGRIQRWKDPATLCRALARLGAEAPVIDWFGRDTEEASGGSHGDYLAREFPRIWGARIRPHPPVPPAEISLHQSAAAFVVVPSAWDVFNLGAAEAMAQGAIVICSRGAGASDLITHGVDGFLFDHGDDEELAACIRRVLALRAEERTAISARARKRILDTLAPAVSARAHAEQLLATAQSSRPSRSPSLYDGMFFPRESEAADHHGLDRISIRQIVHYLTGRLRSKFRD
ncbi:glycosyltransferase family 4 protein [Actomonas aquatica]|uniref:Glycosyltransferase family 4 protein n=1 Tax=Actomonas aquatica TaxID=2866162 RepID=A0ABZ1CA36_9BACT|nr:glycosyltransferase family 4 protein [Opitutus sp. WL0086]WRQ88459.1 glycosyltransferase family 4 protein [Opitutus sp. WL0086]